MSKDSDRMAHWTYVRDGQKFGPTDTGGLRQLARSMHLARDCTVFKLGETTGALAASIPGLTFATPEPVSGEQSSSGPFGMDREYLSEQRRLLALWFCCGVVLVLSLCLFVFIIGSMI